MWHVLYFRGPAALTNTWTRLLIWEHPISVTMPEAPVLPYTRNGRQASSPRTMGTHAHQPQRRDGDSPHIPRSSTRALPQAAVHSTLVHTADTQSIQACCTTQGC